MINWLNDDKTNVVQHQNANNRLVQFSRESNESGLGLGEAIGAIIGLGLVMIELVFFFWS